MESLHPGFDVAQAAPLNLKLAARIRARRFAQTSIARRSRSTIDYNAPCLIGKYWEEMPSG